MMDISLCPVCGALSPESLRAALDELKQSLLNPPRVEFIFDPVPPEMADVAEEFLREYAESVALPPEHFDK